MWNVKSMEYLIMVLLVCYHVHYTEI